MTIQPYNEPSPAAAIADYQNRAVARLAEWAHSADAAFAVAERLVQSSFVPAAFRGKSLEAGAAILAGSEVGLSPMAALRSFDIIGGQAAPRAITLRAIVQSYGHEMVLVESTTERCRMKGRRRGSESWQNIAWTMDRARNLGLAGKDSWRKQPQAMLLARATSELARLIAADAILGIGFSFEELSDGTTTAAPEETPAESAPAESGSRRMSRPRKEPTPEPAADPEPPLDEPAPAPVSEPREPNRRGRMFALFSERPDLGGVGRADEDRASRLRYTATAIDRQIETSNDLTDDEVEMVIGSLESDELAAKDPATRDPWGGT